MVYLWQSRWLVCLQVSREHVKGRAWLFVGQCWLAVNKGDGRVERTLRVCTQGIGFAKVQHSHTRAAWTLRNKKKQKKPPHFYHFSHFTLCSCRCCVSSYLTTWLTTTYGYLCTAAPAQTRSHALRGLLWACCCCWDMRVSMQLSYHRWMIWYTA